MRVPPAPPALGAAFPELSQILQLLLDRDWVARAQSAYWTWDDLRRRPHPGDASPEVAWRALSLHRASRARPIPLLDHAGRGFTLCMTDEMWEKSLQIERSARDPLDLRVEEPAAAPGHYRRLSGIEEALHSSLIEGAVATRQQARDMVENNRPPRSTSERMVLNNFRTLSLLERMAGEPLMPEGIHSIHREMTRGTLDDPRDEGRVQDPHDLRVSVQAADGTVLHQPPPAAELPGRLQALCDFANSDEAGLPDPIRASLLHFQLAHDHPFVDGNGRTARALFYWYMLRRGHDLVRYLTISRVILGTRVQYANAFLDAEAHGDVTYFVRYHLRIYEAALHNLAKWLAEKRTERAAAEAALDRFEHLNLRQRLAISEAIRRDDATFTAKGWAHRFDVTHQTAMADLRGLVGANLLREIKIGREHQFRLAAGSMLT